MLPQMGSGMRELREIDIMIALTLCDSDGTGSQQVRCSSSWAFARIDITRHSIYE